jgi:hypothetical protein
MQIMPGKSRSGHGTKRPFDSDVSRMSIPLSGTYVVPTLFIVTGLLALSAPIPAASLLLFCAVVGATAATIAFALQRRSTDRDDGRPANPVGEVCPAEASTTSDSGRLPKA